MTEALGAVCQQDSALLFDYGLLCRGNKAQLSLKHTEIAEVGRLHLRVQKSRSLESGPPLHPGLAGAL